MCLSSALILSIFTPDLLFPQSFSICMTYSASVCGYTDRIKAYINLGIYILASFPTNHDYHHSFSDA